MKFQQVENFPPAVSWPCVGSKRAPSALVNGAPWWAVCCAQLATSGVKWPQSIWCTTMVSFWALQRH